MKSRQRTADLLKGLAVLFMIQVHLLELFAQQQIYDGLVGKISLFLGGPPAAPIFMAVMGYFLAFSNKGLKSSLMRGGKLIIWGLALNIGLNLNLFYHIYNASFQMGYMEYLLGVDILFLAGLSVIIIGVLKHFFKDKSLYYIVILLIIILLPEFFKAADYEGVTKYIMAYFYSNNWWSYFPLIPWLAYVLLGYILKLEMHRIKIHLEKKKTLLILGALTLVSLGFANNMDVSSNLEEYYHHGAYYFFFVLAFMILWTVLANEITNSFNNKGTNYIEWLGKNVTRAYVFQWLIIGNIATAIYKTQNLWQLSFWLLGIIAIVSMLVYVWGLLKKKINSL